MFISGITSVRMPCAHEDLTWTGAGGPGKPEWGRGVNWEGLNPPANPTPATLSFRDVGIGPNTVNTDWTVGTVRFRNTTGNYETDLAGNTLTVGTLNVAFFDDWGPSATLSNGTLRIRDELGDPGTLNVAYTTDYSKAVRGVLTLDNATFDASMAVCRVGISHMHGWCAELNSGAGIATLDMTNATIQDGLFKANELHIAMGSRSEGYVQFSSTSGLTDLEVTSILNIAADRGWMGRIGDPDNGYLLPPNVNITLGDWGVTRCDVSIGGPTIYSDSTSDGRLIASSGGTCTAYIGRLRLGTHQGGDQSWAVNGSGTGILDLRNMDSVTMDVTTVDICAEPPVPDLQDQGHNDGRGYLYLPSGTVVAGDVVVAHPDVNDTNADPTAEGVLGLNGTVFTVNDSLAVGPRGTVETNVDGYACGLDIAAEALVDIRGVITITFLRTAQVPGFYWGFRWQGDHQAEVQQLIDDGKIVIDSSLIGEPPEIVYGGGYTSIGYMVLDGDANADCVVNILDLIFVRNRLNQDVETGDNWMADVNSDGKINILDLIYVRNRLNTRCPE